MGSAGSCNLEHTVWLNCGVWLLFQENVVGAQCQQCDAGTFYLEERNSKGCTSCFCFGQSTQCYESRMRRTEVVPQPSISVHSYFNHCKGEGLETQSVALKAFCRETHLM